MRIPFSFKLSQEDSNRETDAYPTEPEAIELTVYSSIYTRKVAAVSYRSAFRGLDIDLYRSMMRTKPSDAGGIADLGILVLSLPTAIIAIDKSQQLS